MLVFIVLVFIVLVFIVIMLSCCQRCRPKAMLQIIDKDKKRSERKAEDTGTQRKTREDNFFWRHMKRSPRKVIAFPRSQTNYMSSLAPA